MRTPRSSILLAVLLLSASSAWAGATFTGKVTNSRDEVFTVFTVPGGQLEFFVTSQKRSVVTFLAAQCDDGASAVSGSLEQVQTLSWGVDPGAECEILIRSRGGTTKIFVHVRGTGIFDGQTGGDVQIVQKRGKASPRLREMALRFLEAKVALP